MTAPPDDLGFELAMACDRFMRFFRRQHPSDTTATWRTLAALNRGGRLRLGAVAEATWQSQPGATEQMRRLAAAGWVERRPDPADGRAALFGLTAQGREHLAALRVRPVAAVRRGLDTLTEAELDQLASVIPLLIQVVEAGEAAADETGPVGRHDTKGIHGSA